MPHAPRAYSADLYVPIRNLNEATGSSSSSLTASLKIVGEFVSNRSRLEAILCRQMKKGRDELPDLGAYGGDDGDRTHDLRLAKPALSQLSYVPS